MIRLTPARAGGREATPQSTTTPSVAASGACRTVTFVPFLIANYNGYEPGGPIACRLHVHGDVPDYQVTFVPVLVSGRLAHAYRIMLRSLDGDSSQLIAPGQRFPRGAYDGFKSFQRSSRRSAGGRALFH